MASAKFIAKVQAFGPRFMADLGLQAHHVAGMFGNFAVETGEFKHRQELAPTVKGSKGGIGWSQWTGMGTAAKPGRRRQFESAASGYDLTSEDGYDEACYAFVVWELRNTEKAALVALKRTTTAEAAAASFCKTYERPGVPHLEMRSAYALTALAALGGAQPAKKPAATVAAPVAPAPAPASLTTVQPGFWSRLWSSLRGKPALPAVSAAPAMETKGDPVVFRVQKALSDRGYTEVGRIDGLKGGRTDDAVSNARAVAGLPRDGGIDDAFLAALPKLPPRAVSIARASATVETLRSEGQPAVASFADINLIQRGLVALGIGGGVNATGVLDSLKQTAEGAQSTLSTVGDVAGTAVGVLQWCIGHWWIFATGFGLWTIFKVATGVLDLVVKFRQGFLTKPSA